MPKMENPTNLGEVIKNLAIVSADLYNRVIEPKVAKEFNNTNGKIISACKAAVEASHLAGKKPDFKFMKMD